LLGCLAWLPPGDREGCRSTCRLSERWNPFYLFYAEGVKILLLAFALTITTRAQAPAGVPRFEDFPVTEVFKGEPAQPVLTTSQERLYRTVIRQGVSRGWGTEDGATGKELGAPGPNFAGHYVIVTWGCGVPCLMGAIVDLRTGRIFPPPFHHGPGHSYFQVPWAWPMSPPFAYRLNSRLLIANICEADKARRAEGHLDYEPQNCGAHYFVMSDQGPRLILAVLEK
jgi:hypothetical protein